jgi:radical SAM superfamily enzyme YgiQ (UPF0313 family)
MAIVEMSRGCTFQCSFCSLNKERMGFQARSPETVMGEIYFLAKNGIKYIHIIDPTLGLDKKATEELLHRLAIFHQEFPAVGFEVLTRPELVSREFAKLLKKAGVRRCAIGMETMDGSSLSGVRKTLVPDATRKAVFSLAECNIETKLFHILFPGRMSSTTIQFLLSLSEEGLPFIVQTSFLRQLPHPNSGINFIDQDQTIYVPKTDTPEQLMEWMLVNLGFPSMDVNSTGDASLSDTIRLAINNGKSLDGLFKFKKRGLEAWLKFGDKKYVYIHQEGFSVSSCMLEGAD